MLESEASSGSISAGFPSVLYFDSGVSSTLSDADDNISDFDADNNISDFDADDNISGFDADDNISDFESILPLQSYDDEDDEDGNSNGKDSDKEDEDREDADGDADDGDEDEDADDGDADGEKDEDGDVTYTDDIDDEPDMQMDDMKINITVIRKINGAENLLRVDDLWRKSPLKVGITAKHGVLNEDTDQWLDIDSGSRRQSSNFFILDLDILSINKILFEYQTIIHWWLHFWSDAHDELFSFLTQTEYSRFKEWNQKYRCLNLKSKRKRKMYFLRNTIHQHQVYSEETPIKREKYREKERERLK